MLLYEHSSVIDQLLGSNTHYRVPLYQRRYVWNEMNWDRLWKDILFQLQVKEQQEEEGHPTHFMGPIVTRSIGKKAYEVIDGQQRLATFQIILCVIRDLCNTQEDTQQSNLASAAAKYIVNDEDVLIDDPDCEFTFIPTKHDQSAFSLVTSEAYLQNRANSDKHSILKAYNHFANLIQEYVGENIDYEKMRRLLRSITDRFSFIHITLRSEDEHPAKVFASINATGRKLSEFDYLRNDLFLRAENKAESFYEDYWDFEMDPYWKEQHRLNSFFRTFLMAKRGPDCFEKNVQPFEVYQQYREGLTTEQGIEYEFNELSCWAKSYQSLQQVPAFENYKKFCDDLSLRDVDSFLLLLDSFLLFVGHTNSAQFIDATKILESYIIRSLLVSEEEGCTHADIKKRCFETIESYFRDAVSGSFCINSFKAELLKSNPDLDNAAGEHLFWWVNMRRKNAAFIAYVFDRIMQRHPGTPLRNFNWEMHQDLQANIEDLLSDVLDPRPELIEQFETLWPKLG